MSGGVGDVGDVPGMCGNVGVGLVWALWGARCGEVWRKGAGGGGKMRTMMPKTNAQEVIMFHCCRIAMAQVVMHVALLACKICCL